VKYFAGQNVKFALSAQVKSKSKDFGEMKSTNSPSGEFHSPKDYFTRASIFHPPDRVDFTGAMFYEHCPNGWAFAVIMRV